jgi:hypothetical protein
MSNESLTSRLEKDYAPAWRPQAGDALVGEVVDLSQNTGYDGAPYPIIVVKQDDGQEFALHAFHVVARNELAKQHPQIGERIGIRYTGDKATADGRGRFHGYRIVVDRPQAAFNWGAFQTEPEDAAPVPSSDVPSAGIPEYGQPPAQAGTVTPDDDVPFAPNVT